jgi:TonB-dependent starch-binding outer membrane protein SusC
MRKKRLLLRLSILSFLVFLFSFSYSQNKEISGRITDSRDGSGLPGVTVLIKGTKKGVQTLSDGRFKISVPNTASTLVISSVGYASQEISITSGAFEIALVQSANSSLNDVIVIGYGTARKKDLTGSIATVNSKDFQTGTITSPDQLIAGKVAGVSVTPNSGEPGSGSTIRIRGLASLNGNNDPLYVVDGVPLQSPKNTDGSSTIAGIADPLASINPDDIESITVLKDASAAAIYGSRASSGVIMITTKKGKSGSPQFNFNTILSAGVVAKDESVLSPAQFRNYVNTTIAANPSDTPFTKLLGTSSTDWQKQIYQTAITTNSNLSVSGAMKNLPYRVSVGYINQQGILKTDDLQRTSAAIHISPRFLDDHLRVEINLNGSYTQSTFANQGAIGAATAFDPTQSVYSKGSQFGGYFEWLQSSGNLNSLATRNPVALLQQYHSVGMVNRSFGNVNLDYKMHFLPELHAILNLGYDAARGSGKQTIPADAAQAYLNQPGPGYNHQYLQKNFNTVLEFSLNYVKDIPSIKSNINLTGGYGFYNTQTMNYNYAAFDAKGDTIVSSAPLYPSATSIVTLLSYYGRLIYTLDNKYILAASLRSDGSSRFGPQYRFGTFPAVSVAWRIKQEDFLRNVSGISDLKIRASYGVTGNQDGIGYYGYIPSYYLSQNGSQYQLGNNFYYMYTPSAYDANLRWEQTASTNLALDYGFVNNRITGSVEYYYKNTTNLLNNVFIPVGQNFTNENTINIGSMTSQGVEFSINATPIKTKKFSWDFNYNIAYNNTKITKLTLNSSDKTFFGDQTGAISGATGQTIQIQTVGYSPNSFFVLQQIYNPKTGMPIEGLYVDRNRDGQITQPDDQYRYKSPFAPVIMGFSTQFSYLKWSLSAVARANIGNYIYNNVDAGLGVSKYILNPLNYLENATTDIYNSGFVNSQFQSDYYVQNASFVKIDNIGLGYNWGKLGSGKVTLRLSANCQNAFVITKYRGIDPEVYGGIDNNLYPRPRTFTLGASLGF